MTKLMVLCLMLALAFALSACGNDTPKAATPPPAPEVKASDNKDGIPPRKKLHKQGGEMPKLSK